MKRQIKISKLLFIAFVHNMGMCLLNGWVWAAYMWCSHGGCTIRLYQSSKWDDCSLTNRTHHIKSSGVIPFDECAFGSNDGWSQETNWIAGHCSGYVAVEEESGCAFLFIRWFLAIRAVVDWAATESLSLVTMYWRQHTGKHGECWNSRYMKQQKNNQWWFQ